MSHVVKVYEVRKTYETVAGRPVPVERPVHLCDLQIEADSVDAGRAAAVSEVRKRTGRAPRSLNCLQGGGFVAIVPAKEGS